MSTLRRRRSNRGSVALIVSIVVVVLVVVVLVFHFLSRRQPAEVKNFQELVMHVDKLNGQIMDREGKIMDLVRKYNISHPNASFDTSGISAMGLSPEQAEILSKRVAQEKDVSYRGILQEVIDLNTQVSDLNKQLDDIRAQLPKPYEVQQGDSHFKVCLEWLTTEKGVPEDEAVKLIEQTSLTTELLPGFEVWNYYEAPKNEGDKAVFGTFVTQGTAKLSPNALARATKRRIDSERQNLIQARNQKEEEVKDLEQRRSELLDQIKSLDEERKNMMDQMGEMASKNEALAKQINSVSYVVGTFKDLSSKGIIRKPTLGKWETADMDKIQNPNVLDMRSDTRITFTAASVGLGRIKQVLIFPRSYDEGSDFKVTVSDDKQTVTIDLLKREKFQLAKLAIAVDG
jgi:predicted  nucleic acid-binding Zn-ribbon protein